VLVFKYLTGISDTSVRMLTRIVFQPDVLQLLMLLVGTFTYLEQNLFLSVNA
jgi:hypothetical protein